MKPLLRLAARVDPLCLVALALLFSALGARFLADCYDARAPGGWDGVSHFAVAGLYGRHVFPRLSGWMPEYFGGFPFPDLYPPMLYLVLGALQRLGVGDLTAYWIVETGFAAAVPLLVYACTRRLTGRSAAALVAGVLAVTYMVDDLPAATLGIALRATFDLGEASHLPAFVFLLAFFYCFLDAPRRPRAAAWAAVFLACVPLTNVHVVWNAALLFGTTAAAHVYIARDRRAALRVVIGVGAVAAALAGCWVIPMFARLRFAPTLALEPPSLGLVVASFHHLTAYVLAATVVAVFLRAWQVLALGLSALLVLGFGLLPADRLVGDLAIQPVRVLAAYRFLAAPMIGWLVVEVAGVLSFRHARTVAVAVAVSLVLISHRPLAVSRGKLTRDQEEAYARVLEALGGRTDGRVLVEHGSHGGDNFALQALVGRSGAYSLTSVFRESSLDVLLAVPLRNALSGNREMFAVDSKLPGWRTPLPERLGPIDRARLDLFDVRYLAATSELMKQMLAASTEVERLTAPGLWELWARRDARAGFATVVPSPVLTFAALSVKRRAARGLDFVRLGEEQFVAGRFDPTLALARGRLDDPAAWDPRFAAALVVDYRYDDLERAAAQLERYTRDHALVALADDDPLAARIAELARSRSHVRVVQRTTAADLAARVEALRDSPMQQLGDVADLETTAEDCARLFAALDAVLPRPASQADAAQAPHVTAVRFDGPRTEVELDAAPTQPTALWIKQGYFPGWVASQGRQGGGDEPVYLASPTFQLAWAAPSPNPSPAPTSNPAPDPDPERRRVHLRFSTDRWHWVGALVALLGLGGLGALGRRRRDTAVEAGTGSGI